MGLSRVRPPQPALHLARGGPAPASGLHDGGVGRVARARTELTVEGDRGFESTSLQRRVSCEPEDDIDLCASSQYRYPSSKKDAGVDDHRHRQGCGWQTRDRETLPSRTERKGERPAPRQAVNRLSQRKFHQFPRQCSR